MKKTYKKFLLLKLSCVFAVFCFFSCSLDQEMPKTFSAQDEIIVVKPTRSYDEALACAEKSISLIEGVNTRALKPRTIKKQRGQCVVLPATRSGNNDTLMYIFNFEDNAGFSVIAAKRSIDPVLAVVEKGNYIYGEDTGVESFDCYMHTLTANLSGVKPPEIDTIRTLPTFKKVDVNEHRSCHPLLPVNWGQQGVFGKYFSNGIAGCVTVAVAQVMAYYQWPTQFTTTYSDAPHSHETIVLDWDTILDDCDSYKVSAFLYEIGKRVNIDTSNESSSSAYSRDVPPCFRSFGFMCSDDIIPYATERIWDALDGSRPLYVNGRRESAGHAWVIDGYEYSQVGTLYYEQRLFVDHLGRSYYDYVLSRSDVETTNLLHYNWGWDGLYNGYFTAANSCSVGDKTYTELKIIDSISL